MDKVDVKFGDWIERGFNLFKANMANLIVCAVPLVLVMLVTVGASVGLTMRGHMAAGMLLGPAIAFISGPLLAGFTLMVLKVHDGVQPPPVMGDITQGFRWLVPAGIYLAGLALLQNFVSWMLNPIPCIGGLAAILVSCAIGAMTLFVIYNLVDRGMSLVDALKDSAQRVLANFWPFLGLYLVVGVIGAIGALLCGVGMVVTLPAATCILTVSYRAIYGRPAEATAVPPPLA